MTQLTQRRKEMVASLMKDGIYKAAVEVVMEHGADGLTMDRVAETAGVAKGSLYNYFQNKRELIEFIHERGALVKVHICGDITHLLPDLAEIDPDIVDCDHMVDMDEAYRVLGENIIRSGNLDPVSVLEYGSAESVAEHTRALVDKERGRPFILSAGCEITPLTAPENLLAMREASRIG